MKQSQRVISLTMIVLLASVMGMIAIASAAPQFGIVQKPRVLSAGRLVYTNVFPEPNGIDSNIWMTDLNGSNPVSLTTSINTERFASVSAQGDKVSYSVWTDTWVFRIHDVEAGTEITMPLSAASQKAAWSPAGDRLTFGNVGSGGWQLWLINADGTNAHQLTTNSGSAGEPSWAPDGQRIVYAVEDSPGYHGIYTINATGTGQTQLLASGNGYGNLDPAWSPDGTEIAFIRYPAGNYQGASELWVMNANATDLRKLSCCTELGGFATPSWTPDSSQIYFGREGNIWRIDRDGSNLAQITTHGGWEPSVSGIPFHPTDWSYLPMVMVPVLPTRTPTPTPTLSPTPSPTPVIFPGIYGKVTLNGVGIGGVPVEVRYYNGSSFSTRASGTTASNGNFDFTGLPSLGYNQAYYVRYRNTTDGTRLGYWATRLLTSYSAGSLVHIGDFDVQDLVTTAPINDEHVTFPYTFKWVKRSSTPSDNYQITFYDANNMNHYVQSPTVGYVGEMNIQSLPSGFNPGQNYLWEVWANQPDTAFGVSFALRPFYYVGNSSLAPNGGVLGGNNRPLSDLRINDIGAK